MPMVCFEKISTSKSNFEGNSTLPSFYCSKLNFTSQWCFPICRWWINDQFQCINVFLYTTVFVFIMDFLLLSSPSVWIKWHMTKTFSNPQQIQKQDKIHFQRLANNLNSITLLSLSPAHLFQGENIWFLSIFKTCVGQIKFEETAQYLSSGRHIARFHLTKIESGILQFFLMIWRF